MMKKILLTAILPLLATTAFAQEKSEGRNLAELTFESVDEPNRGFVDMGQMENQRDLVFISMDTDDNEKLSETEFTSWGFGFQQVAEEMAKQDVYQTALRIVFNLWDRNNDGMITPSEHRKAILADFERADLDDNAVLSKSEFLNGFSILVAIKTALKP